MIVIDGKKYNIKFVSLKRSADFLDKFAERTEDGELHREMIGTYYNFQLKLGWSKGNPTEYDALWETLSNPTEFHDVVVPYGKRGTYSFKAYFADVSDELMWTNDNENYWNNLTVNFVAQKPAKT